MAALIVWCAGLHGAAGRTTSGSAAL